MPYYIFILYFVQTLRQTQIYVSIYWNPFTCFSSTRWEEVLCPSLKEYTVGWQGSFGENNNVRLPRQSLRIENNLLPFLSVCSIDGYCGQCWNWKVIHRWPGSVSAVEWLVCELVSFLHHTCKISGCSAGIALSFSIPLFFLQCTWLWDNRS